MKISRSISFVLLLILLSASFAACDAPSSEPTQKQSEIEGVGSVEMNHGETFAYEASLTEKNQKKLHQVHDLAGLIESINYSNELANQIKRFQRFNDPTKVSYVCLLTQFGDVFECHTVMGKISALDSQISTDSQIVPSPFTDYDYGNGAAFLDYGHVVQSPQIDGSYNTNGSGIFWFDTEDAYHEWNGLYKLKDRPFVLVSRPLSGSNTDAYSVEEQE